jgi:hypothetical protein
VTVAVGLAVRVIVAVGGWGVQLGLGLNVAEGLAVNTGLAVNRSNVGWAKGVSPDKGRTQPASSASASRAYPHPQFLTNSPAIAGRGGGDAGG